MQRVQILALFLRLYDVHSWALRSMSGNEPMSLFSFPKMFGLGETGVLGFQNTSVISREHLQICEFKKRERESIQSTRCIFELSDWHLAFDFHFALIRELTDGAQKSSRTAKGEYKKVK